MAINYLDEANKLEKIFNELKSLGNISYEVERDTLNMISIFKNAKPTDTQESIYNKFMEMRNNDKREFDDKMHEIYNSVDGSKNEEKDVINEAIAKATDEATTQNNGKQQIQKLLKDDDGKIVKLVLFKQDNIESTSFLNNIANKIKQNIIFQTKSQDNENNKDDGDSKLLQNFLSVFDKLNNKLEGFIPDSVPQQYQTQTKTNTETQSTIKPKPKLMEKSFFTNFLFNDVEDLTEQNIESNVEPKVDMQVEPKEELQVEPKTDMQTQTEYQTQTQTQTEYQTPYQYNPYDPYNQTFNTNNTLDDGVFIKIEPNENTIDRTDSMKSNSSKSIFMYEDDGFYGEDDYDYDNDISGKGINLNHNKYGGELINKSKINTTKPVAVLSFLNILYNFETITKKRINNNYFVVFICVIFIAMFISLAYFYNVNFGYGVLPFVIFVIYKFYIIYKLNKKINICKNLSKNK